MTPPDLSVVIPTRNRRVQLAETVEAIRQDCRHQDVAAELIIVDDGSTDSSLELLRRLETEAAPSELAALRVLRQRPRGPAAARNLGVRHARADFTLFLGDDTRPVGGAIARHLELLKRGTGGVQGFIEWDPEREITPLMEFLAPAGPQFYFRGLKAEEPIPFSAVLGSNLSVPTRWLLDEPFDEGFPFAAMEDTELAWRWQKRGRRILYAPDAVCLHHHRYEDIGAFLARQQRAGISARYAVARHKALFWKLWLQPALMGAYGELRRLGRRPRPNAQWERACRYAYLKGFFAPRPTSPGSSDPTRA